MHLVCAARKDVDVSMLMGSFSIHKRTVCRIRPRAGRRSSRSGVSHSLCLSDDSSARLLVLWRRLCCACRCQLWAALAPAILNLRGNWGRKTGFHLSEKIARRILHTEQDHIASTRSTVTISMVIYLKAIVHLLLAPSDVSDCSFRFGLEYSLQLVLESAACSGQWCPPERLLRS